MLIHKLNLNWFFLLNKKNADKNTKTSKVHHHQVNMETLKFSEET